MLSAFTARPIVELRPRDKFKIESILAYGDRLLVGLSTGSLRVYRVNELPEPSQTLNGGAETNADGNDIITNAPTNTASNTNAPTAASLVDLLREQEKFSSRSIDQLAIIKEANILISLSNYYVSIHDLHNFTLQEQLVRTKNASTFAVTSNIVKDATTGIPEIISRLAVAVKRKLLLWSWHESELSSDITEIHLPESIRTLTWASATNIICGMNMGYVMVDILTQKTEDIIGPGAIGGAAGSQGGRFGGVGSASMGYMGLGSYIPKPLASKLADGELLLAKDINSLFISSDGKPEEKRQIPWQAAPDAIGYSYPYILSLQAPSKGTLEVRNPDTLSLLQSISLPNASQLHFPPPTVSRTHSGKGFHVVSDRCVWRMGTTDYDTQVDELVENKRYDEAISILTMLEDALLRDKTARLLEIKVQKAQQLFRSRKYQEAGEIFTALEAPPEDFIKLFPKSIAGDLSAIQENPSEPIPDAEEGQENGEDSSESEDTKINTVGSPKPAGITKILKSHQKANSDASSIKSFIKLDSEPSDTTASTAEEPLQGKDLINAALELNAFLVGTRNRMKKYLDMDTGKLIPQKPEVDEMINGNQRITFESPSTLPDSSDEKEHERGILARAKLVDTTLFKSYMLARPQLAGSLFRIPNFCDPDVVNEKLLENGRFNDLVDFFHGKKLHRPALELLKKFGTADSPEPNAPTLHGPQRTIAYLQALPPEMIDLILEFADWALRAAPEEGMEIFLGDTENAETLPRERVVTFLAQIDPGLAVQYLDHIVNELDDATPEFHNRLVAAYMRELKDEDKRETDEWGQRMVKLLALLRSSRQYSLSKAFGLIPRDDADFYEAQAIVLCNMGQHKQALEIYVFKMEDFAKAEEYCNRVHMAEDSPTSSPLHSRRASASASNTASTSEPDDAIPSIYHTLLSLYLTPPKPHSPNWPPALDLVSKHGSRLPASSTLNLIPATLPVAELESYFRGRIRSANSIVNETRIVAGLRKTEVVNAQAELLLGEGTGIRGIGTGTGTGRPGGRNRRVLVTEERVCGVCHKRLGPSVVAVLPDNAVIHYGCLGRIEGKKPGGGSNMLVESSWGR